ncbi:hypothetical protein STCU_12364 [Strigomonas culicis]|uniref:Uncharacterized protein n=1 Tax=Strigomonas culicis TaxID=28005 RepID=S9TFG8_9TRYP|nr:hypothetical protein STCU_12364 [Strigomonas culicis]|eukprot:EPY15068.1 hypothetical protein STCU_12364 [Strigomonas culicis]
MTVSGVLRNYSSFHLLTLTLALRTLRVGGVDAKLILEVVICNFVCVVRRKVLMRAALVVAQHFIAKHLLVFFWMASFSVWLYCAAAAAGPASVEPCASGRCKSDGNTS